MSSRFDAHTEAPPGPSQNELLPPRVPAATRTVALWTRRVVGAALLVFLTVLLVRAFDARGMPDLQIWHTANLQEEFQRCDETNEFSLTDYL